jgi:hypothetical protein
MSAIGTGEKIGLTPMVGLLGRSRPWYAIGCIEPKDLLQRGWVVKSLANRQVITRASLMRRKFFPTGGERLIPILKSLILLISGFGPMSILMFF